MCAVTGGESHVNHSRLIAKLADIHGIGRVKARELIDAGVSGVADLRKKKYQKYLSDETRIWLKYPIARNISREVASKLISLLKPLKYIYPVGSYRRKAKVLSDIDLLTTRAIYSTVIDIKFIFSKKHRDVSAEIIDTYNSGEKKISLIARFRDSSQEYYIHVDIFHTEPEDIVPALLHFTGGKTFNIRTRAQAKRLGYKLTQYGLFKEGEKIPIESEKQLLKIIGVTWIPPEQRE